TGLLPGRAAALFGFEAFDLAADLVEAPRTVVGLLAPLRGEVRLAGAPRLVLLLQRSTNRAVLFVPLVRELLDPLDPFLPSTPRRRRRRGWRDDGSRRRRARLDVGP